MEDVEDEETQNQHKAWFLVAGKYLSITEQFRCMQASKTLKLAVAEAVKDSKAHKVFRSDPEVSAVLKMMEANKQSPISIELEGGKITHEGALPLVSSGKLESLTITDCDFITDQTITIVGEHSSKLLHFEVDCRPAALALRNGYNGSRPMLITDKGMKYIATGCPKLKTLALRWSRQITDESICEIIRQCHELDTLRLMWTKSSDKALSALSERGPILKEIDLRTCKDIGDIGLSLLFQKCLTIKRISLVDVICTDICLKELSGACQELEHLFLSDLEGVTDAGLRYLANGVSMKLKSLHLSHLKNITNEGLVKLIAACKGLTTLDVSWVAMSDDGLNTLANMPNCMQNLRVARFDGLKEVTDSGLTAFIKSCSSNLGLVECFNSKTSDACAKSLRTPTLNVVMTAW